MSESHEMMILEGLERCIREVRPEWRMWVEESSGTLPPKLVVFPARKGGQQNVLITASKGKLWIFTTCPISLAYPNFAEKLVERLEYCHLPAKEFPCKNCPARKRK